MCSKIIVEHRTRKEEATSKEVEVLGGMHHKPVGEVGLGPDNNSWSKKPSLFVSIRSISLQNV